MSRLPSRLLIVELFLINFEDLQEGAMAAKEGYRNRKKLNLGVKQEFQRWLLLKVLFAVVISALIAACVLYFYARQEVVGSFFDAHVKLRRVSELLLPVVVAGSMVSLLAGGLLALFLPQKIAGPIFQIERGLKLIKNGDLTFSIQLRSDDTLQDFAETVNQTIGAVRGRVQDLKDGCRQLEAAIAVGDQRQIAELLSRQNEQLEKLKT